MRSELYLVQKIIEGRVVSDEQHALMRNVELALPDRRHRAHRRWHRA